MITTFSTLKSVVVDCLPCIILSAVEPVHLVDTGSNSSVLTDLSHRYVTTQHGMTAYQHGGHSTHHGTYSAAERGGAGIGGYFADEAAQLTDGHNTVPGTEGFYSSEQSHLSHCKGTAAAYL